MKYASIYVFGLFLLISALPVSAVTIYECVDEEGNTTFQDFCPTGTTPANEKKIQTGSGSGKSKQSSSGAAAPADVDILFYSVPDCDSCFIIRGVMNEYSAPFTEVNVNTSDDVKREMQEKVGENTTLTVPTVIVGETVIAGFKKDALINALEQAGFQKPEAEVVEPEEEEASLEETAFLDPEEEPATEEEAEPAEEEL